MDKLINYIKTEGREARTQKDLDFRHERLEGQVFKNAKFDNLDMRFANLKNAEFYNCSFKKTNLENSILTGAKFESCNLDLTNLVGSSITQATKFKACLNYDKAKFTALKKMFRKDGSPMPETEAIAVQSLNTSYKKGVLNRSQKDLTEKFRTAFNKLKNGG